MLRLLRPHFRFSEAEALASAWARDKPSDEVLQLLQELSIGREAVVAATVSSITPTLKIFDDLIASAERRRDRTLRELHGRRQALARDLRRATEDVQDADFTAV